MRDFMQKYKKELDDLKIRDSFEDEIFNMITDSQKKRLIKKKFYFAKISRVAAMLLFFIVIGGSGYVMAKSWNIDDILGERFFDKVSADKIKKGEYDELAASGENGEITAKCINTMGDERTYIMLLEVSIKKEKVRGNRDLGFGIKAYCRGDNPSDYKVTSCPAEVTEEDDETVRCLVKYEMPLYFANYSSGKDEEIIIDICNFILDYKENPEIHSVYELEIPVTLSMDSIQKAEKIEVNQSMMIKNRKVFIENICLSEYKTEIEIKFYAKNYNDANKFWKIMAMDYIIDDNLEYKDQKVYLKLFHNGNPVDFADDYRDYAAVNSSDQNMEKKNEENNPGDYVNVLNLKAVDYKDGDTLELRYGESCIKIK